MFEFRSFCNHISNVLKGPLPGYSSHKTMSPIHRIDEIEYKPNVVGIKESAVLVLLFPYNGFLGTVVIKRSDYEGVHGGQISFPGGKREIFDKSLIDTAVREAKEEIGINPDLIEIAGTLSPLFVPPSNFNILPVIGITDSLPDLTADALEVNNIFVLSLEGIYNGTAKSFTYIKGRNKEAFVAPAYRLNDVVIWGATAMIIAELSHILSLPDLLKFFRDVRY